VSKKRRKCGHAARKDSSICVSDSQNLFRAGRWQGTLSLDGLVHERSGKVGLLFFDVGHGRKQLTERPLTYTHAVRRMPMQAKEIRWVFPGEPTKPQTVCEPKCPARASLCECRLCISCRRSSHSEAQPVWQRVGWFGLRAVCRDTVFGLRRLDLRTT